MQKEGLIVTIVTPSYNLGHFIRATIESVLSQDYPMWNISSWTVVQLIRHRQSSGTTPAASSLFLKKIGDNPMLLTKGSDGAGIGPRLAEFR
jgi:hypothetical protein